MNKTDYRYCPQYKKEVNKVRQCISCLFSKIDGNTNLFDVPCNFEALKLNMRNKRKNNE